MQNNPLYQYLEKSNEPSWRQWYGSRNNGFKYAYDETKRFSYKYIFRALKFDLNRIKFVPNEIKFYKNGKLIHTQDFSISLGVTFIQAVDEILEVDEILVKHVNVIERNSEEIILEFKKG